MTEASLRAPRSPADARAAALRRALLGAPARRLAFGAAAEAPAAPEIGEAAAARDDGARWIPKSPFKVLPAPGLSDDFYLDLVCW